MRRRLRAVLLAAAALLCLPEAGAAQQDNVCQLRENNFFKREVLGTTVLAYVSGPLLVTCERGEQLRADSAVIYEVNNEVHLYGRVDYQDPTRSLTSDYATYNSRTGRLYATGSVVFTDRERGSTLRGPELEYFRQMEGRPESQMIAPQRPHLTLVPKTDPDRPRREPLEIDADRITTLGQRFMSAEGNVVILGTNLDARGGIATFDQESERLELQRDARVKGDRFDLTGEVVEADMPEGRIERVVARRDARLVNEKLTVDGPELHLFFARDSLQRMVAGQGSMPGEAGPRPVATADGFRMEADSLEALLPGQRLRQVIAIGTARGEAWDTAQVAPPASFATVPRDTAAAEQTAVAAPTDTTPTDTVPAAAAMPDSAAARLAASVPRDRDLIFADTIIGFFVQVDTAGADTLVIPVPADTAAADTTAGGAEPKTELERMLALGDARSLYRMRDEKQKREGTPPGINYVIADTIELNFADGEVQVAHVRGLDRGVYLDPVPPGAPAQQSADAAVAPAAQPARRPQGRRP